MSTRPSAGDSVRRSHFSVSRHAITTTTVCLTSAVGLSGAFAQTAAPVQVADAGNNSDEILVTGVRPILKDKLAGGAQDVPQSVDLVSQQIMTEQAATRLEDALKNVPGITLNAGEGAARGDTVNLRGFSAFNDFFLDGIRDAAVYVRDSFNLDSVEVLKGPSAVLFGRGSTGGVINQVSKAPGLAPVEAATIQAGTNDSLRATADVNLPIADHAAIRVNVMDENSGVAGRPEVDNKRWGFAPSIALGIGQPDSLVLSYLHQDENDIPDTGIPFVLGSPAPVARDATYGLDSDRFTATVDIGTARAKHDFNSNVSIADTLRYANYQFGNFTSAPNFGSNPPTALTPLTSVLVGRDDPASSGKQTNLTNQTDLTARFKTGSVSNVVIAGVELARQTNDLDRYNNPFNKTNNWIAETPLLHPNPNEVKPFEPVTSTQDTTSTSEAAYISDTIYFGDYVDLLVAGRYDRFAANYNQITLTSGAALHLEHADNVPSPRVAIVVHPTETQRYYVSYGTSFDPSAEALSLTAKTANLAPVKAKTYELGSKTDWLGGMLSVTGAVFRTEVDNAQTNDPDDPTVTVLAGDQRVNGFELGASGYITEKLEILAGYTYLDAITVASGTAANVGKFLPNTARNALNVWLEYDLTDKWEVGTGGNWLGHRYADSAQTANIPSYVVWNGMAAYSLNDHVKIQLNGANLLNKLYYENAYYTSTSENHVIPGAGRTVTLSTNVRF